MEEDNTELLRNMYEQAMDAHVSGIIWRSCLHEWVPFFGDDTRRI